MVWPSPNQSAVLGVIAFLSSASLGTLVKSHDRGAAVVGGTFVISWRPVSGCSRKRVGAVVRG